jgi:DNA-binding PadR family transcriptional regulator
MTDRAVKLTKGMRDALRFILASGPGTIPPTKAGRTSKAVVDLLDAGMLETLNRIRPGPAMYEITEAGRRALETSHGK